MKKKKNPSLFKWLEPAITDKKKKHTIMQAANY